MKFCVPDYIVLIVADLDRAVQFYAEVMGLPLGHRSGAYAQFSTGATRLALYHRDAIAQTLGISVKPPADDAPGFELGFKVADVDAAFAEMIKRGATAVTPPTDRPWGQRTAYVRDPDGHLIEFAQDRNRSLMR
jgi:lactoylglutathione lyase